MIAAAATERNIRTSRVRVSPRTGASAARPTTNGITPIPIASEPAAQSPRTRARCFQYVVTPYHGWEWWLPTALIRKTAPKASVTTPR